MYILRCLWPPDETTDDNILSGECLVDIIYNVIGTRLNVYDILIHPILTKQIENNNIVKIVDKHVYLSSDLKSLYVQTLGYNFLKEMMNTQNKPTQK